MSYDRVKKVYHMGEARSQFARTCDSGAKKSGARGAAPLYDYPMEIPVSPKNANAYRSAYSALFPSFHVP